MEDLVQEFDKKLILVVEDEFLIGEEVCSILRELGYQIRPFAMNLEEATASIEACRPDLVLLDIQLNNRYDGLKLAKRLRYDWDIPFIFLSSHTGRRVVEEAKVYQPYGYIVKPVRKEILSVKIEMALYKAAYEDVSQQEKERKALLELSSLLVGVHSQSELMHILSTFLKPILPFQQVNILLVSEESLQSITDVQSAPPGQRSEDFQFHKKLFSEEIVCLDLSKLDSGYRDDGRPDIIGFEGMNWIISLPMRHKQRRIGYLVLTGQDNGVQSSLQTEFLKGIADQLANAMNGIVAMERVNRERAIQRLQISITDALNIDAKWSEKYLTVARKLQSEIPFKLITFSIKTKEWQLRLVFERIGLEEYRFLQEPYPPFFTRLFELESLEPFYNNSLSSNSFCAILNKPMPLSNGGLHRITFYHDQQDVYHDDHIQLIDSISSSLTLAIEKQLAYAEVKKLSKLLQQEKEYLQEEIKVNHNFGEMVGKSEDLQKIFKRISQVANTDTTVLVTGESGTGKELIARALHSHSPRNQKPLIKLNCAALPPQLLESELFGHERGSFTGAIQRRIGKFEIANKGTIFLDEIGELPIELQAKLLRVLQEKEFERLGSNRVQKADVRIIAATNRDLPEAISLGKFRTDLYYRLNVFPIHLPPLRERKEDIVPLALHFLKRSSRKLGKRITGLSSNALREMMNYDWPGNIRELQHMIERAVILNEGTTLQLQLDGVGSSVDSNPTPSSKIKTMKEAERELILTALRLCKGKIRGVDGAAKILDINPNTLDSRMKKLGIVKEHVVQGIHR